ncbi:MAG: RagB/SusD family nutrient uptake outer membrane protein [Bacteroidales bacterium]|nr:RagB/SusD family nutrient uptake outer membrane protein [Bacteroidales bacterium]MDD2426062.1 RagB/SusD family nutrient uptake outer membrane protein [Bacteroidales bacterium]MDD3990048.1 RagB/SusD family nutrient uptake outer membrane protein [Bacteroidales bacterium]MDD4638319.1 RagB/SusD family nutrient uptake outer membrane protein [Bacteroidales bacterium]
MKTIFKISTIILVITALTSCDKFLSLNPPHKMVLDNAVTTYDGAVSILNGMYASTTNITGSLYVSLSAQAGIARANSTTYYPMSYNSTYSALSGFWQGLFGSINAANAAIIGIGDLPDSKFPSLENKQTMLGEARTFRAWNYAHLLWCFSHFWADDEYGVLWREELADFNNIFADRISVKESYEKIIADLDAGIASLPDYTTSKRLSKQMAQVIKAKLLLNRGWTGDYQEALGIVNDVLSTAPTTFKMDPDMQNMFKDSWDSQEVLFARYMEDGSGRAYSEGTYSQTIIQAGDQWSTANQDNPSSLKSFYPEFDNWINADPRYDATMGWARAISSTGILYFCPTKLAREGRPSTEHMNDKFATYYFRFPELYLLQAELRARTNASIASCIEPINTMRSKRTNPVLPALAAPASREEMMELIFKEYCLELYMENGSEWFAALRFQKNSQPILYLLKPDVTPVDPNLYCWPIPSTETSTNNFIKSNPGYDN